MNSAFSRNIKDQSKKTNWIIVNFAGSKENKSNSSNPGKIEKMIRFILTFLLKSTVEDQPPEVQRCPGAA